MNTSIALFNGLSRAAGRTIVTGTLRPSRALAVGLRRPFSTILGVLPGLSKFRCTVSSSKCTNRPCLCVVPYDSCQLSAICSSHKVPQPQEKQTCSTESFTKALGSSVAAPTLLAVVRLYALVQRIDLAVQAKDELLSEVSRLQSLRVQVHCTLLRFQALALQLASTHALLYDQGLALEVSCLKVCKQHTTRQDAYTMALQCLSCCWFFDFRLWQVLGTAKQMQQLQRCWQGLSWVWWATLRSGRMVYGSLQKILQGAGWTESARCVFECHPIQSHKL
jgi:hypothetical protein